MPHYTAKFEIKGCHGVMQVNNLACHSFSLVDAILIPLLIGTSILISLFLKIAILIALLIGTSITDFKSSTVKHIHDTAPIHSLEVEIMQTDEYSYWRFDKKIAEMLTDSYVV